jgi:hypothetical protein
VEERHDVVVKREALEADLNRITAEYEARIPAEARNPDGTVKADNEEYKAIKDEWDGRMKEAWDRHNVGYENRMQQHRDAVQAAGLTFVEASSEASSWDLRMSGGNPKSIKSDIDMAARTMDAGNRFAASMKDRGHNVLEYRDRWVITDTDTTVWKPEADARGRFAEKVGSSEHQGRVALDTAKGSDKFPTEGGVRYTTGKGLYDPKGAVIANLKKASEAGLCGGRDTPDLHVIGKSVDKAAEIANRSGGGQPIDRPEFMAKAQAVRNHQTAEQAGIVTFGNPASAKRDESRAFLDEARSIMTDAFQSSAQASHKRDRARELALQSALARGDEDRAKEIRLAISRIRSGNDSALRAIESWDPQLVRGLTRTDSAFDLADVGQVPSPPKGGYGFGWLWSDTRGETRGATTVPKPRLQGTSPRLLALADDCAKSAKNIEQNLLPRLKKGSPEAAHLTTLKILFERGQGDPVGAMRNARVVTGYELSTLLRDVEGKAPGK